MSNKKIQWLSPVHTGANPLGDVFESTMRLLPERYILTNSFNLRRNFEPEFFECEVLPDDILVMATDGFWLELNEEQQQSFISDSSIHLNDESLVDDTSVLLFTWSDLHLDNTLKFECNALLDMGADPFVRRK